VVVVAAAAVALAVYLADSTKPPVIHLW